MPRYNLRGLPRQRPTGLTWTVSVIVHVVAVATLVVATRVHRQRVTYVTLAEPQLPPYAGTVVGHGPRGGTRRAQPVVTAPPAAPAPAPQRADTAAGVVAPTSAPAFIGPPAAGDGRLWATPLPALPADVADALYGDHNERDSVAVHRLRAMVDTLNAMLDSEERAHRIPSWTTQIAGQTFGIDSQYIHIAGIKIPTMALALLPISLPQGNYGEAMRARQLDYMRQDIMQAARRTQNMQMFRQYVQELRARNEAERDFKRRQRGDTAQVKKDTTKAIP